MDSYKIEWNRDDPKGAVMLGFDYLERQDEIVGFVYCPPTLMKEIVLGMPDEVDFQYIPEGIGMIRTAYLKYNPTVRDNEIQFWNQEKNKEVRLFLK
ncbi:MAG: hypothetical protein GF334_13210 [Candidatus Altiarchaeales archaeon]|nr:hypothetical protein [Candidatus Altiarchaeales archaeon]